MPHNQTRTEAVPVTNVTDRASTAGRVVSAPPPSFFAGDADKVSFFSSIKAATVRESLSNSAINLFKDSREIESTPGYDVTAALRSRAEELGPMFSSLDDGDFERFVSVESDEELDYVLARFAEDTERQERAEANGFFPYLIGGMASFADPLSLISLQPVTKAYRAWRVGSRLGSLGRGALLAGPVEGGLREALLQSSDHTRTLQESVMAIGLGTVLGGGLGASFPGKMLPKTTAEFNAHPLNPDVELEVSIGPSNATDPNFVGPQPASAGAAAAGPQGEGFIGRIGETTLGRAINMASPTGRVAQMSRDARVAVDKVGNSFNKAQNHAVRIYTEMYGRLNETHLITDTNRAGEASVASVERLSRMHHDLLIDRTHTIDTLWNKNYGSGLLKFARREGGINRSEFDNEVLRMRRFRSTGNPYEVATDLGTEGLTGGTEGFKKVVSQAADAEDKFYNSMTKEMVDKGLLKAEDTLENYFPQIYDREMIGQHVEEFRSMLLDLFAKTPDDDFLVELGHTGNYAALRASDPRAADEALEEWSVHVKADREGQADTLLAEATRRLENTENRFRESKKSETLSRAELHTREVQLARAEGKALVAERQAAKTKVDEARPAYEALWATQQAAQSQAVLVREGLVPFINGKPAILHNIDEFGVKYSHAPDQAKAKVSGDTLPTKALRTDQDRIVWMEAPGEVTQRQFGGQTRRLGELEGATKAAAKRLAKAENDLKQLEAKAARHTEAVEQARMAHDRAKEFRTAAKAERVAARKAREAAKKETKKADRGAKVARTRKTVTQQVDGIVTAMLDHTKTPHGLIPDDVVASSGRTKARQINWGDMVLDPRLQKFMVQNPNQIAQQFSKDIAPKLGLMERFGSTNMSQELQDLDLAFRDAQSAATTAKERNQINKWHKRAKRDLIATRDRILGHEDMPSDPNSAIFWGLENLRGINYVTKMGKVLLSSVTDLSVSMYATNAGFMGTFKALMTNSKRFLADMPEGEVKSVFLGLENLEQWSRQSRVYDTGDVRVRGVGGEGTVTRKVTEGITRGVRGGTTLMNKVNGMSMWNKHLRIVFGQVASDNMLKDFPNWKSLSPKVRDAYLRHGMDERMAGRVAKLLTDHGIDVRGTRVPNGKVWTKVDPEAFSAYRRLLGEVLDEAIIVPGSGDLPLLMSKPVGKLLFQFQSFGFAAAARYVRPGMQADTGAFAMTAATGLALSGLMYTARQYMAGKGEVASGQIERMAQGDLSFLYEAASRSPLLGPSALPFDVASRVLGRVGNNGIEALTGIRPLPQSTKMSERSGLGMMFGPSYGTIEGVYGAVNAGLNLVDGEPGEDEGARLGRKLTRLTPFANVFYIQGIMNALDLDFARERQTSE